MRTMTGAQSAVWASKRRNVRARLFVDRGSGDWVNLADLEAQDWMLGSRWDEKVDVAVAELTVDLRREFELLSLAPFMDGSKLNQSGAIVDTANSCYLEVAIVAAGTDPVEADYMEVFRGEIEEVDWESPTIQVKCLDQGGALMRNFIETQRKYAATDTEVEEVMQDILDDNNHSKSTITADLTWNGTLTVTTADTSGAVVGDFIGYTNAPLFEVTSISAGVSFTILNPAGRTLPSGSGASTSIKIPDADRVSLYSENGSALTPFNPSDTPNWQMIPFWQSKEPLLQALRTLARQIGWECRYRWHATLNAFVLVFYEPDRAKSTPDHTFSSEDYFKLSQLRVSRRDVRNRVKVSYRPTGDPVTTTVIREDLTSQAKYGILYCEFTEDSSKQIDSVTEANAMGDAALSDLKEPEASHGAELPFFPWGEVGDLHRYEANGIHYDTDQDLAPVGFQHSITHDGSDTKAVARGTPSGGTNRWLEIQGRPGVSPGIDENQDDAPTGATADDAMGMIVVEYDDPRTTDPPLHDWATTKCYVSDTGGFTPGAATLKGIGKQTRFEIGNLIPGTTYYAKLVLVDRRGNESLVSTQVSVATQKVGPWHENSDREFGSIIPNPNFSVVTLDKDTTPPDHWEVENGSWENTAGNWYWNDSVINSSKLSLELNSAVLSTGGGDLIRTFRSLPFAVEPNRLYSVSWAFRHDGTHGNLVAWAPGIQYLDEDFNTVGGVNGLTDKINSYNAVTGVTYSANTWLEDRGWDLSPSGARYARIEITVQADDATFDAQGGHPTVFWDFMIGSHSSVRMIHKGGSNDRTIAASTFVQPWLSTGATYDNADGFVSGNPGIPLEHSYTFAKNGFYVATADLYLTAVLNSGKVLLGQISSGGVVVGQDEALMDAGGLVGAHVVVVSRIFYAAVGDVAFMWAFHNDTVSRTLDDSKCLFTIQEVKGNVE